MPFIIGAMGAWYCRAGLAQGCVVEVRSGRLLRLGQRTNCPKNGKPHRWRADQPARMPISHPTTRAVRNSARTGRHHFRRRQRHGQNAGTTDVLTRR
jgi:hypothetical protein